MESLSLISDSGVPDKLSSERLSAPARRTALGARHRSFPADGGENRARSASRRPTPVHPELQETLRSCDPFLEKASRETKRLFDTISRLAGKAIVDYDMIQDGDKIMIGVSGGKDSMTLLHVMLHRQRVAPINFELLAVHVDSGLPGVRLTGVERYVRKLGIAYHLETTDLFRGKDLKDLNCFWCSWNRRKALFNLAAKMGYNKIALAHHLDDIAQTILMNQIFKGEVGAMCPRQELFEGKVAIIRPLAYERESKVLEFARTMRLTRFETCRCPVSPDTQRAAIKKFLNQMEKVSPAVKMNVFNSLKNIRSEYLT